MPLVTVEESAIVESLDGVRFSMRNPANGMLVFCFVSQQLLYDLAENPRAHLHDAFDKFRNAIETKASVKFDAGGGDGTQWVVINNSD